MDEFTLIKTIFQPLQSPEGADLHSDPSNSFLIKIGDDAAVWKGHGNLAFSIDTLVEGVHFTSDIPPYDLGYRALAVNLSDLSAMSAIPSFFTLAITLPKADTEWLTLFAQGMADLAGRFGVSLVGGDTTRGPLSITIQAHGLCPQPVYRHGAQIGDGVYVSGCLGDAAAGLKLWLEGYRDTGLSSDHDYLISRFHRPTPRVELGKSLSGVAHSMLDVSDGLMSDLGHVASASKVSIIIDDAALPISTAVMSCFGEKQGRQWALSGGDDYELAFTVPPNCHEVLGVISKRLNIPITKVGEVVASDMNHEVRLKEGSSSFANKGYNHFAE